MNPRTIAIDGTRKERNLSVDPIRVEPHTGVAFTLEQGEELLVTDAMGEQAVNLTACMAQDTSEWLSGGQTVYRSGKLFPKLGDILYSNLSTPMFTIVADTVGRHDFLFASCSLGALDRGDEAHRGSSPCFDALSANLRVFGIGENAIPTTFNIFTNIRPDPESGALAVGLPRSIPGDHIVLRAERRLIVALTPCAAATAGKPAVNPVDISVRNPE